MGDRRFEPPLMRLKQAGDPRAELRHMPYDEVVQALGAASRENDAYIANVLVTELLNRSRRGSALVFSAGLGMAAALILIILGAGWLSQHPHNFDDHVFLILAFVAVAAGAIGAVVSHSPILQHLLDRAA